VGELGTTPTELETKLQEILELAGIWKASILLDEADIFLEKRSKSDIVRNAMVGIFLRLLEYHQGVLFLTTNRINCIDEAFNSRISVALNYDELDESARVEIWRNFLLATKENLAKNRTTSSSNPSVDVDFSSIDPKELAKYPLNGRQIRSTIRLAQALSRSEGTPLNMAHIHKTVSVAINFKQQFNDLKAQKKKKKKDKKTRIIITDRESEEKEVADFTMV